MVGFLGVLARGWQNRQSIPADHGHGEEAPTFERLVPNSGGILVPDSRVITHPGLAQVEGEGIYTYPFNPDRTRNFILETATLNETVLLRTLATTVAVQRLQKAEDVVITEVWLGGGGRLSALTEMARTFRDLATTALPAGEAMGWQPRDISQDIRLSMQIVDVRLGGSGIDYQEIREKQSTRDGSHLDRQLEIDWKPVALVLPPTGSLTLTGV